MDFLANLLGTDDVDIDDPTTLRTILSENTPDETRILDVWEHPSGYDCITIQHRMGHYCGYVGTNITDHEPRVNVHGGLTYGPDDEGWCGFDCNHHRDITLTRGGKVVATSTARMAIHGLERSTEYGTVTDYTKLDIAREPPGDMGYLFWTPTKVKNETNRLATKLAAMEGQIESFVTITVRVTGISTAVETEWHHANDYEIR